MELLSKKSDESGKRDSVPLAGRLSFLYACGRPQAEATYPKTWTSSPFGPCGPASSYLVLQPIRFTPPECHHPMRELLPHVFTLTSVEAVVFCGTCCYPKGYLPVRKYGALRCPDFPRAGFPDPRQSPLIAPQRYNFLSNHEHPHLKLPTFRVTIPLSVIRLTTYTPLG